MVEVLPWPVYKVGRSWRGAGGGLRQRLRWWSCLLYMVLQVLWRGSHPDGKQLGLLRTVGVLDGPGEANPVLRPLLPEQWVAGRGLEYRGPASS